MTKPYSVAEQLQVDGALRASEDLFEMAFHSSPVAMAITTVAEGRYLEVNEAFERQMGYSRFEICGRTSLELNVWANPDDRSAMIQALERHKTVRDQHAQFRTKWGHLITTLYSAGLVTVDSRPCVLAAIVDITAQVVAEDALREHTALLQTLIANSPFGIIVGGKDHRIRFCNEAFTRMFLYAGDEVVGKDPDDLVGAADDAGAQEISRRVLSGEVVHATATRRRKDGSAIDVDLHAIPLKFGTELVGCFGIYQDITERVEAESKLRGLRARLSRVQDEEARMSRASCTTTSDSNSRCSRSSSRVCRRRRATTRPGWRNASRSRLESSTTSAQTSTGCPTASIRRTSRTSG
jgi:PAS domain S-box-containing protein